MPHLGVGDRVKETTTTTGTGTINLDGAESGFQTFVDGIGNGHETYYVIVDSGTGDYEVGVGTITDATPDTLSRDTVISSSNAGALVNFGAGSKDVFCSLPSERAVIIDDASNVEVTANITATAFDGSGAALTALNASNVSSGTLSNDRLDTVPTTKGGTGLTTIGSANQVLAVNGTGTALEFQTPATGDITGVTAGSGLTGGGTSGDVTLNVGAGTGVTVHADDIAIGQDVATSASPTFAGATFTANVSLGDNDYLRFGSGNDLLMYHNGAASVIQDNGTGRLFIAGTSNVTITNGPITENMAVFNENGSVDLYYDNNKKLETTAAGVFVTGNISTGDNGKFISGTSADLQIYHTGTDSVIEDVGTGDLEIRSNGVGVLLQKGTTEYLARFLTDGASELYYDNVKRFETTSAGVTANGTIQTNSDLNVAGEFNMTGGGTNYMDFAGTALHARWRSSSPGFETIFYATINGSIDLHYDGSKKLETTSTGIAVTGGATFTANVSLGDSDYINLGAGNDLQIFHDGSNSVIDETGTGNLVIKAGTQIQLKDSSTDSLAAVFRGSGASDLSYNNLKKIETTSGGIAVTGAITATGDITAFYTSDRTLKTNIANIENPMEKVAQLNGVSYNWTQEAQATYYHLKSDREVGVIAQEVEQVLPEMVKTRDDGTKGVQYERMCALLIECVKDLQNQINELKG